MKAITVISVILLLFKSYLSTGSIEEYYWRDFHGLVPSDAIAGGLDPDGRTTYIGQFSLVSENKDADIDTIPAIITAGDVRAVAAYKGRSIHSNETSKVHILCGNRNRYSWRARSSVFNPNCRFVIGGYEDNAILFLGRGNKGKEKILGKVFADSFRSQALEAPYQGGSEAFNNYEILTYCN